MKLYSPLKAFKPMLAAIAMAMTSVPAFADAHEARVFGVSAAELLQSAKDEQAKALHYPNLNAPEISDQFVNELQRFGISAARLSREIKEINGPEDFQCIFRGMAKETGDQLSAISIAETGADQANALKRLITMLDDAIMVSEATARTFEGHAPAVTHNSTIGSCSIE
ncbi:hypothetical protein [Hirschia maritima]|uniref:hypothetical protein n=1 Tax=Hirschia maritima TaxID=1121961 RepID=UPI000381BDB8|nr:hypothetical protein [Hirschia maritima]